MMKNDPEVKAVLWKAVSPGGDVYGRSDATTALKALADVKKVSIYNSGRIGSAMFWLASY